MDEKKHTPGPWKIQDAGPNSGNVIRFEIVWSANGTDFYKICEIEDGTIDATNKKAAARMDEANATLLAASPDLLDAIKNLISGLMMDYPTVAIGMNDWAPMIEARAAIRLATGDQP